MSGQRTTWELSGIVGGSMLCEFTRVLHEFVPGLCVDQSDQCLNSEFAQAIYALVQGEIERQMHTAPVTNVYTLMKKTP